MIKKNNSRRLWAFLFCLSRLALLPGQENVPAGSLRISAQRIVQGGAPLAKTVTVTFFGNCGFLVRVGGRGVLFDLESPEKAQDRASAGEAYRLLAAAAPPFEGLADVFISHPHPDHAGIREIGGCLKQNCRLRLYTTADVWEELKKIGASPSWLGKRVFVAAPGGPPIVKKIVEGMEVEFLELLHAGAPGYVLNDLSFVVTIAGVRIFYLSDVDPGFERNRAILEEWSGKNERIDLLFSPDASLRETPWSTDGAGMIKRLIRPERVVAMHIDPRAVDEVEKKVRENFPAVIVFRTAGETVAFPGAE